MDDRVIGVLGCGIMGSGIVETCAKSGYITLVREISEEALEVGKAKVLKRLNEQVEKGSLVDDERRDILSRLQWTTELKDLKEASFVIEAIIEDIDIKKRTFAELGDVLDPKAVVASNTSSYSITELASVTRSPHRVVGLHFFYPVPLMKLVEVVKTEIASPEAISRSLRLAKELQKDAILVMDKPGFVVNRLLVPYFLDAIRVLEEGLASVQDIDKGMTEGAGFVIGPFRLLDQVGLDTIYSISKSFYNELRERRFAPPPLLKRMVLAGHLGRKSGKGFYEYK
jgi:3-hydroxybutyryl-CoA dehydrogenase